MKYKEAQIELRRCLQEDETIDIPKLRALMNDLNIGIKSSEDNEVNFLKGQLRECHKKVKALTQGGKS